MKKIKLQSLEELKAGENLSEVPELIQKIFDEAEAFRSYISKGLGYRWHTASKINKYDDDCQIFEDGRVVVLLARHSDSDYNPITDTITDSYQIYFWVQGQGFGSSDVLQTGLRHPSAKFYNITDITIGFKAMVISRGKGFLNLEVKAKNQRQNWSERQIFHVEWEVEKSLFEAKVEAAMENVIESHQHVHPLYKSIQITESVIDSEKEIAAWILFEQIDTDRNTEEGEGFLGDQFCYSLWKMGDNDNNATWIYEDHAYIRQYSKSEFTGTRGHDCTLKDLRIEDGQIKVLYLEGERVEDQEWGELTF